MLELGEVVPKAERKRRSDMLHRVSEEKVSAFYEKQMGKTGTVLWESRQNGDKMLGFTENYIRVEHPFVKEWINTLQKVTLGGWNDDHSALRAQ